MINIHIETQNLIIREFTLNDSKDVSYYSQQPNVAHWLSDMIFSTEERAYSWIKWINETNNLSNNFIILAIENKIDSVCIGVVGIHPKEELDNEVEILYAISDNYQNKGYATEASKALLHWTFNNTDLQSLCAIVKPANIPSKTVIEKLGFNFIDTKLVEYDGEMCTFNYYKLYKKCILLTNSVKCL